MAKNLLFTKDQITQANSIDLIEFAKSHGYILENGGRRALHAKQSGGLYFFRDRNKYDHFSTDTHGGPIDFVMQFWRMGFKEAVAYLLGTSLPQHIPSFAPKERGQLLLPAKAPNYRRVAWYLVHVRGIEPEIVSRQMHEKKLYQQGKTGNVSLSPMIRTEHRNIVPYGALCRSARLSRTGNTPTRVIPTISLVAAKKYMSLKALLML